MAKDVNRQQVEFLLKKSRAGDMSSLGRLLSWAERDFLKLVPLLSNKLTRKSLRIGITGPPGAGKSTLLNAVVKDLRSKGLKVAVLAVDPSSPFSGGAVLGDRVRMTEHATDPAVFIRSIGSRGSRGGLSSATGVMARVLDECGFDIVLIETVGVGQTELGIMNLAHATAVVLVPESGDIIQTMKAGILEIADIFVVNKSDRPNSEALFLELKALVEEEGGSRKVLKTVATLGEGVSELTDHLVSISKERFSDKKIQAARARGEVRDLALSLFDQALCKKLSKVKVVDPYIALKNLKIPKI